MSGPVSSAVISEAVSRLTSLLTGKYSKHNNVQEWIDRLVMARIQIESALLESEEFDINNDEPLHKWQEKLKEALCEAEEALSNFQAEILHQEPNQTIEGGHTASNLGEAVTRQVDLEANLPHYPFMHEEGSDDVTLVHPASNLREAVSRQVDQQANLPHDPFMQEEGSDDATLVHTASNLREAVVRQVNLEANLRHDPFMQEEGSDDATFVQTASNLTEAVTHQVDLEANLPHDPLMQEEGSDDATLVHTASNLTEAVTRQVNQQANLPHDQPMQEEGSHGATLVHPSLNLLKTVIRQINLQATFHQIKLQANLLDDQLMQEDGSDHRRKYRYRDRHRATSSNLTEAVTHQVDRLPRFLVGILKNILSCSSYRGASPRPAIIDRLSAFSRLLDQRTFSLLDPRMMVVKYLENDEKLSKLLKTVEKLEKMAGDIGNFIKLLEFQKKRMMNRKRKRSGAALQVFFLVIPLKLQTYALFCYGKDLYLLVIMLFRANCDIPTGITSDIFIRFIM